MECNVKRFSTFGVWLTAFLAVIVYLARPLSSAGQDKSASPAGTSPISSAPQTSSQSKAATSQAGQSSRPKMKTFSSPEEAAAALYAAARNHDEDGMLVILGPDAKDVVMWTEDPADRKADTDQFVEKYGQMHRLVKEPDNETTLYVGAENWPLPIPLMMEKNGAWYFDCALGRREIMFRRIGQNELDTVDVLHAMVDAQNEYAAQMTDSTGAHVFASRFDSDPGQHNGLYWPGGKSPDESPIGPYLAQASFDSSNHKPLHGYYFRILTEQGPNAPGGTHKYVVDGKMTGGFAFVAFPAEYKSSGVMAFIVGQNDVVYEKNLGPMTPQLAKDMAAFNPDSTWTKVH
jgi:hypothetical protein